MEAALLARLADAKLSVQNIELELELAKASLSGTSGIPVLVPVTDATPHSSSKDVINLMPGDLIWLKQEGSILRFVFSTISSPTYLTSTRARLTMPSRRSDSIFSRSVQIEPFHAISGSITRASKRIA